MRKINCSSHIIVLMFQKHINIPSVTFKYHKSIQNDIKNTIFKLSLSTMISSIHKKLLTTYTIELSKYLLNSRKSSRF